MSGIEWGEPYGYMLRHGELNTVEIPVYVCQRCGALVPRGQIAIHVNSHGPDRRQCADHILPALRAAMKQRSPHNLEWIETERQVIADAANQWAADHHLEQRVTVADVERLEATAVGHVDYASKIALYTMEALLDGR